MSGWPCRCSAAGRVPAKHRKSRLPFLSGRSAQLTVTVWLPCRHSIPPPRRLGRSHVGTRTHTCQAGIWQRYARHRGWVGDTASVSSTPREVGCTLLSDGGEPHNLPHTGTISSAAEAFCCISLSRLKALFHSQEERTTIPLSRSQD